MKTFKSRTFYEMSRREFRDLIIEMYSLTKEQAEDWICEECVFKNRGSSTALIETDAYKSEFVEYEQWLKECAPPNQDFGDGGVSAILYDAANRDLIPEGEYLVHFGW